MKILPFNVWLLMAIGSIAMTAAPMVVFTGGFIGAALAPSSSLATLPVAVMVVGTAVAVVPVTFLMQKVGRKRAFLLGSIISAVGASSAALSIAEQNFWWFCSGIFLLGAGLAFVQQYRFAAMESVEPDEMASAAARVLLGGLIAAYVGPEISLGSKDLFSTPYVGGFVILAGLYVGCSVLILFYRQKTVVVSEQQQIGRDLSVIAKQPIFWAAILSAVVGYAVMSFVMTATPISMHIDMGHSLADTKWVIQSHIMAMFIPSFFSGWLIGRLGASKVMLAGVVAFVLCIIIAFVDQALMNYWLALILLGIGWNFLFVGGTSLLPHSYREGEQFKAQAFNEFCVFGFQAVASLSSGWVLYTFGWHALLLICVPLLLVVLLALYCWKQSKHKND
ncbi:MFS transporter [Alkalimarinus sediminis]|uniref:MFS transporter n=1 Tax=Alkalimarinus sediminis TaxID=1632866 RepID=A0A9E8KP39_9ALTE|nr:MFS transporter [Alkalimarinus sediminis]UZW74344.1 MFS transporter [Alkalimarinus sediminis]